MKYVLGVLVDNHPGVLSRVSGLFSRRGFNIESLAVGVTENPAVSRITIVVDGDEYIVGQVTKQLNKLINVIKVSIIGEDSILKGAGPYKGKGNSCHAKSDSGHSQHLQGQGSGCKPQFRHCGNYRGQQENSCPGGDAG